MNYQKHFLGKLNASSFKQALTDANFELNGKELEEAKNIINNKFKAYLKETWFKDTENKYFDILCKHSQSSSFVTFENKFKANLNLLKDIITCK